MGLGAALFVSPAGATPPAEWGKRFCSETTAWTDGAAEGYSNLIAQTSTAAISAKQVRSLYLHYLKSGVAATKQLIVMLVDAGEPEVARGKKIQAALLVGLAGAGTNLSGLVNAARALDPTNRKTFLADLRQLDRKITEFSRPFQSGLATADKIDRDGTFAAILSTVPECAPTTSPTTPGS